MKNLASAAVALLLLHVAQTEAACREGPRPSVESTRGNCERIIYPGGDQPLVDVDERMHACVLVRPVQTIEMERARESLADSNCFLEAVLRPEVSDAIRRGAKSYLAMRRIERRSLEANELQNALEAEFHATWNPDMSEDVLLLVGIFIERAYRIEGWVVNPASGLEKSAQRQDIYSKHIKEIWVLYEYAAYLTGSRTLASEATGWLKAFDRPQAPPAKYFAKDCRKKISYEWPRMSRPRGAYDALPADPPVYGPTTVHVGICPGDQSLWVYHYLVGWRKVSDSDVMPVCKGLFFSYQYNQDPVAMACKRSE